MQNGTKVVMWERVPPAVGHSLARLERTSHGWHAHGSEVLSDDGRALACSFEVAVDETWTTRSVRVAAVGAEVAATRLEVDEARRWWQDGERRSDLDGCVDVDVAATPLTNTFPIRRLADLPVGERRTAPVAWVEVPSLRVLRVDQTYRRLGRDRWEYSDPTHGAFVLVTDADGLVVDYEGFATRVPG